MGSFTMGAGEGDKGRKGPPPVVQKVLSMFGSKREEDKMVGYLSFLKVWGGGAAGVKVKVWGKGGAPTKREEDKMVGYLSFLKVWGGGGRQG